MNDNRILYLFLNSLNFSIINSSFNSNELNNIKELESILHELSLLEYGDEEYIDNYSSISIPFILEKRIDILLTYLIYFFKVKNNMKSHYQLSSNQNKFFDFINYILIHNKWNNDFNMKLMITMAILLYDSRNRSTNAFIKFVELIQYLSKVERNENMVDKIYQIILSIPLLVKKDIMKISELKSDSKISQIIGKLIKKLENFITPYQFQ